MSCSWEGRSAPLCTTSGIRGHPSYYNKKRILNIPLDIMIYCFYASLESNYALYYIRETDTHVFYYGRCSFSALSAFFQPQLLSQRLLPATLTACFFFILHYFYFSSQTIFFFSGHITNFGVMPLWAEIVWKCLRARRKAHSAYNARHRRSPDSVKVPEHASVGRLCEKWRALPLLL